MIASLFHGNMGLRLHLASPGLLFVTEWGAAGARLLRAAMDGRGRTDLVTEDIVHPQAVTLDLPSRCRCTSSTV